MKHNQITSYRIKNVIMVWYAGEYLGMFEDSTPLVRLHTIVTQKAA